MINPQIEHKVALVTGANHIVAPGPIQTGYLTPENEASIAARTPLRRIGRPGIAGTPCTGPYLAASRQRLWCLPWGAEQRRILHSSLAHSRKSNSHAVR